MQEDLKQERILLFLLASVFLCFPSLRAAFKFLPHPVLILLLAAFQISLLCLVFFTGFIRFLFRNLFSPKVFCLLICLAVFIASIAIYPYADARRNTGRGSTADDAMIQCAKSFLAKGDMYAKPLPSGEATSPGPAWVIINIPFSTTGLYRLLSPFYILAAALLFKRYTSSWEMSALALIALSVSMHFWELLVTGHDLVAVGFALVAITLAVRSVVLDKRTAVLKQVVIAVLLGILSTSRVVFLFFPIPLGILAYRSNQRRAFLLTCVSVLTAVLFHLLFYYTSDFYQPFHLFGKGSGLLPYWIMVVALLLTGISLIWLYARIHNSIAGWLCAAWFPLSIPMAFLALGDLQTRGWNFALWEGANYLMPCIPPFVFYLGAKLTDNLPTGNSQSTPSEETTSA